MVTSRVHCLREIRNVGGIAQVKLLEHKSDAIWQVPLVVLDPGPRTQLEAALAFERDINH